MGYDVSFHPISPEEMQKWYFTPLTWVQQGQEEKVLALAAQPVSYTHLDVYKRQLLLRPGEETIWYYAHEQDKVKRLCNCLLYTSSPTAKRN